MVLNQTFPQLLFFAFAAMLITAATMTVVSRNPVRSVLFLVMAFFAAAALWILLTVEFLGLILILVYIGAVMTLFLFVVMMLDIRVETQRFGIIRYIPYGIAIVTIFVALVAYAINPLHFPAILDSTQVPADYSNIKALGSVLYTHYVYPFEIAGVLLLVAIVAAISLSFRGRSVPKGLSASEQINIRREDRVRIVKMKAEKR